MEEVERLKARAASSDNLQAYRLYSQALAEMEKIGTKYPSSKVGYRISAGRLDDIGSLRRLATQSKEAAFSDAATKGDLRTLQTLLDEGCTVNSGRPVPAVQCAIEAGQLQVLKLLVKRKADPYCTHDIFNLAVNHWRPEIIEYLYEQTHAGDCNLLRVAIERGDLTLVNLIMSRHPDYAAQPCGAIGNTPLWEAARKGDADIVKALLPTGTTIRIEDYRARTNTTPLEFARQRGHSNVVAVLQAAGETE